MMCTIIESLLIDSNSFNAPTQNTKVRKYICQSFIFSYLWSLGSNLNDLSQTKFEDLVFNQFENNLEAALSPGMKLLNMYLNTTNKKFENWNTIVPTFEYNAKTPYFELLVPTVDSVRYSYIVEKLVQMNQPVMLTGITGKHLKYKYFTI